MRSYSAQEGIAWLTRGGAVRVLIIINVAVFVLANLFRQVPLEWYLGIVPAWTFSRLMLWQLITYMFVHVGLVHLVLNMLMLWMFGSVLEKVWGTRRFVEFYFFCGVGAGLVSALLGFRDFIPIVGASGVIYGMLAAFAILFPEQVILLFILFPMKMRQAVWVMAGINLLAALSSPGSSLAYIGHLAGGACGYLYLKNERLRAWLSRWNPSELKAAWREQKAMKYAAQQRDFEKEVDRILDKISCKGMASLSKHEQEQLKKKSRMM